MITIKCIIVFLFITSIVDLYYIITKQRFYQKYFSSEEIISRASRIRMKLIKMLHEGDASINSVFFKYTYRATSHLIRAVHYYGLESKTIEAINQVNIIKKFSAEELQKESVIEELKTFSIKQKDIFCETTSLILMTYFTCNTKAKIFHNLFKFFFKVLNKNIKKEFAKIVNKNNDKIPNRIKEEYIEIKTLDKYACFTSLDSAFAY